MTKKEFIEGLEERAEQYQSIIEKVYSIRNYLSIEDCVTFFYNVMDRKNNVNDIIRKYFSRNEEYFETHDLSGYFDEIDKSIKNYSVEAERVMEKYGKN